MASWYAAGPGGASAAEPTVDLTDEPYALDLLQMLSLRGIDGSVERLGDVWRLHVSGGSDPDRRLLDVLVLVEAWLVDRGLAEVGLGLAGRTYRLHRGPHLAAE